MTKSKKAGVGDGYPQALGTATSKKKLGQGADGLTSAKLNRNMTTPEERGFQSGWYRSSAADPMMYASQLCLILEDRGICHARLE